MEGTESGSGCALIALGVVAGFAAIEGGMVLIAAGLHQILGMGVYDPIAMATAVTGALLLFAGPQLWFLAARAWPKVTAAQALAAIPDLALASWLVAAGISAAFHTAWLFIGFWMLMANKFIGGWLTPPPQAQDRMQLHGARWGLSAGL